MSVLRTHLRTWIRLWLVIQVLALGGLLPADCCTAHASTPSRDECAADCPMHQPTVDDECPVHGHSDTTGTRAECAIGGICHGPATALSVLLSPPAVLPLAMALDAPPLVAVVVAREHRIEDIVRSLDLPPPRS
jgi:hypothetical protein